MARLTRSKFATGGAGSPRRRLLAGLIAAWVVLAIFVPLSFSIGPTLRTGSVSRRLHGELSGVLAVAGQQDRPHPRDGSVGRACILGRLDRGSSQHQAPGKGEGGLLELEPIGCRGEGIRLSLARAQTTQRRVLSMRGGFHWYLIKLASTRGRLLALSLACVSQPGSRLPSGPTKSPAMAIAGVRWTQDSS